ncbi:MAG: prepilin peptidase [Pirellulaceae bacterium]|nr:prepilin peptidase [Pirellulaceae bacterium]
MEAQSVIPWIFVAVATVISALTDICKYKVYNIVTMPLVVSGFAFHLLTPLGGGLAFCAEGMLLGLGILIVPFALGGVGAGDVKLLAGIGAWLGPQVTFWAFVVAALAAGACGLAMLLLQRGPSMKVMPRLLALYYRMRSLAFHLGGEETVEQISRSDERRHRLIPFGALLAIAVLFLLILASTQTNLTATTLP